MDFQTSFGDGEEKMMTFTTGTHSTCRNCVYVEILTVLHAVVFPFSLTTFNPLNPSSDQHQISPNHISGL